MTVAVKSLNGVASNPSHYTASHICELCQIMAAVTSLSTCGAPSYYLLDSLQSRVRFHCILAILPFINEHCSDVLLCFYSYFYLFITGTVPVDGVVRLVTVVAATAVGWCPINWHKPSVFEQKL